MSEFTMEEQYAIEVSRASCMGCSDPYNSDEVIQTDADVLRYVSSYCATHTVPMPQPTEEYVNAFFKANPAPPAAPAAAQAALDTPPATTEAPAKEPTAYQVWQAACKLRKETIEAANEEWKRLVAQRKDALDSWDAMVKEGRARLDTAKKVPTPKRPATAKKKSTKKK